MSRLVVAVRILAAVTVGAALIGTGTALGIVAVLAGRCCPHPEAEL